MPPQPQQDTFRDRSGIPCIQQHSAAMSNNNQLAALYLANNFRRPNALGPLCVNQMLVHANQLAQQPMQHVLYFPSNNTQPIIHPNHFPVLGGRSINSGNLANPQIQENEGIIKNIGSVNQAAANPLPEPFPPTPSTAAKSSKEEEIMPWDDDPDWVPTTSKGGKQKSPNQIRNEFQRYLDSCGRKKKDIMQELGVGNNSFYKFMNPGNYRNQWSATQNETYWAAAKLLARQQHENKKKSDNKKRKPKFAPVGSNKKAKAATESRAEAEAWMETVLATTGAETEVVYDSCPQVIQKIKQCLSEHPGLTKAAFCKVALNGSNSNALAKFLASKKQDQQGNAVYRRAYAFFEKLRVLKGEAKGKARLKNEQDEGASGFETTPARKFNCYYVAGEEAQVEEFYRQHLQKYSR